MARAPRARRRRSSAADVPAGRVTTTVAPSSAACGWLVSRCARLDVMPDTSRRVSNAVARQDAPLEFTQGTHRSRGSGRPRAAGLIAARDWPRLARFEARADVAHTDPATLDAAAAALERDILDKIVLARAMAISVVAYDGESLTMAAPLAPNVNDKGCAFGGSLVSLMTLAGWGLVKLALGSSHGDFQLVLALAMLIEVLRVSRGIAQ